MIYEIIYVKERESKTSINKRVDVFKVMKPYIKIKKEQLILITLDSSGYIIGIHIIHVGSINSNNKDHQEIIAKTLLDKSRRIIICRTIIDEDVLSLSPEDYKIAQKFFDACKLLDIQILFQLIVSEYGYTEIKLDPNNDEV
jgi:DNA repair protein RadC